METTLPSFLQEASTAVRRDLKLNLEKLILGQSALSAEEANLALLALARSLHSDALQAFAESNLQKAGVSSEEIQEAAESSAIMGMLNTYYKFRHMLGQSQGTEALARYQRAGLRMNSLSKPILGAQRFEMLAFAVSVLNGCETCIGSHEKVLLEGGLDSEKVHDLARLAAVVKGISALPEASLKAN